MATSLRIPQFISLHLDKRDCVFHNKVFYELVEREVLTALINHDGLLAKWDLKNYIQSSNPYENEKKQLEAYNNNYNPKKKPLLSST